MKSERHERRQHRRLVRIWGDGHKIAKKIIAAVNARFFHSEWEDLPGIRNTKCYEYKADRHHIAYGKRYVFVWIY